MKTIKGFEGEKLEVSDFGEWVGNDFIDYKFEYENNQKIIKILQQRNQRYKKVIDTLTFIKNRAREGATQETINKLAINFVHAYLKYGEDMGGER